MKTLWSPNRRLVLAIFACVTLPLAWAADPLSFEKEKVFRGLDTTSIAQLNVSFAQSDVKTAEARNQHRLPLLCCPLPAVFELLGNG